MEETDIITDTGDAANEQLQAEKTLAEREAAVAVRELKALAAEKLSERKLPAGLISCMNYSSKESFDVSFDAVCSSFSEAVRKGIGERVHTGAPGQSPSAGADAFLEGLGVL